MAPISGMCKSCLSALGIYQSYHFCNGKKKITLFSEANCFSLLQFQIQFSNTATAIVGSFCLWFVQNCIQKQLLFSSLWDFSIPSIFTDLTCNQISFFRYINYEDKNSVFVPVKITLEFWLNSICYNVVYSFTISFLQLLCALPLSKSRSANPQFILIPDNL